MMILVPLMPCRPSAALVSRRWHRVYWEEPGVWRDFKLLATAMDRYGTYNEYLQTVQANGDELDLWLPAKQRLLGRVAGTVRHLSIKVWWVAAASGAPGVATWNHGGPRVAETSPCRRNQSACPFPPRHLSLQNPWGGGRGRLPWMRCAAAAGWRSLRWPGRRPASMNRRRRRCRWDDLFQGRCA